MTRQHFKALAEELSQIGDTDKRWAAAEAVIRACLRFNSGFKRDRFLKACGLGD